MQISTNWSVSHLRHWRPPVASSGYYLYRYTGRSWFKSKQSALRSILPNANIHHNEKGPRDRTMTDSWCPYWCLLLTPKEEDKSNPVSSVRLYEAAHTIRTEKMSYMGLQRESVDDGWVFPCATRKQGLKRRVKESQKLFVTIEKVGGTYEGGGQRRLASLLNVGSWGVSDGWERKWGCGVSGEWVLVLGHHEQSHNWEIVLTVNQQPNNMISVAYVNITVRYSLKTGKENRKLSQFFLSLSFLSFFFYIKYVLYEGAGGSSL